MQKLRALLALCFSFRGTIAPKPYVIGSLLVIGVLLVLSVVVDVLISLLLLENGLAAETDAERLRLAAFLLRLLYLAPLAAQFSLAARRLRDAGRPLTYLLIPPGLFLGIGGSIGFALWTAVSHELNSLPPGDHGQEIDFGVILLFGLGILLAAFIAHISFSLLARLKRRV